MDGLVFWFSQQVGIISLLSKIMFYTKHETQY